MKRYVPISLLALLGACSATLLPPNVAPVVPPTRSMPEAESKLAAARTERAAVEARFAASEQFCYTKFFVNDCLDEAKEKRRLALVQLKAIEIEAEYFQRKSLVEARDRAVDEAEKTFAAEEARRATAEAAPVAAAPAPVPRGPRPALAARRAEQAARQARIAAEAPALEAKRAANAADYAEKRAAALKRQERVAAKKLEKEKERAAQAAKEAQRKRPQQ